jgi:hypothetical protein
MADVNPAEKTPDAAPLPAEEGGARRGLTRPQLYALIGGIGITLFSIAAALFAASGSEDGARSSSKSTKFRARSGSMRENIMPLMSKTQERMDETPTPSGGTSSGGEPGPAKQHTLLVHESVIARIAEEALDNPSPQEALDGLQEHLDGPHDTAEDADIHNAMAQLKLKIMPPDVEGAQASADDSSRLAKSPEEHHRAAFVQATIAQFRGDSEAALELAETALARIDEPTQAGLRLGLMAAALHEGKGNLDQSTRAYRRVMNEAATIASEPSGTVVESYRLATMKLTAVLRKQGDYEGAESLAREARAQLNQLNRDFRPNL